MSPETARRVTGRRLEELAHALWLPRTASRAEVAAAIEALSDGPRKTSMRASLASIPDIHDGRNR